MADIKSLSAGAFQLAELDMAPLVPPDVFAPFAEEAQAREQRRRQRAEAESARDARDAAAAAAAMAKTRGPSAAELKVATDVIPTCVLMGDVSTGTRNV